MTLVDSPSFKKILARNVLLPLAMSSMLLVVFLFVVLNLLEVNRKVAEQDLLLETETEVIKLIIDAETGLRGFLLTRTDVFKEPYLRALPLLEKKIDELNSLLAESPRQLAQVNMAYRQFKNWQALAEESIKDANRSKSVELDIDDFQKRKENIDRIRETFDRLELEGRANRADLALKAERAAKISLAATVLITLLLGALLALAGRRQLLGLSRSYETSLKAQAEQTAELTAQAWVKNGQAQLAEHMRGVISATELGDRILRYCAEYTGAKLGAIYFMQPSGEVERTAQFAFSNESSAYGSRFKLGEGLVGQVARDKKISLIHNLPDDYIVVASGTGKAKPRALLLSPLVVDEINQGVLELGFLDPPPPKVLEMISAVTQLVGGAIRARSYQERLQQLLHESQQLTEELQTQQEELRVSNEELEERTRILQETQVRLESQHAELEQSNEQLEEQASLLEEQKRTLDLRNSDLESARQDLEQKAREIAAASQYKSEFLANMSHELRTPLNSSLILAKLLKDNPQGNLSAEQVEFAATIYSAGNDLLLLINDILDLSKVEAGKLEIHPESLAITQLFSDLKRTFSPIAKDKKLELKFLTSPNAPEKVTTDRSRLEQVLKNLLANALKFTSQGSVELSAAAGPNGGIRLLVKDTGIGIDPSQHQLIFDAFRQADGTSSRKFGGTGLGLSISRNLAELLGGTIELESEIGKGSTFILTLPAQISVAAERVSPRKPVETPAPKRVELPQPKEKIPVKEMVSDDRNRASKGAKKLLLMVEDDMKYAKILLEVARGDGFTCLLATSVDDGFQLAKDFAPVAILLDMRLPDGSGLGLLDRLKRDAATRHIPVYGMSVHDYSREALHLGAAEFTLKALDAAEIKKTLAKIEAKASSRGKRVLLVEDDAVQRKSVERLIATKGVEIEAVGSGEEALAKLSELTYDCTIIDLKLPDMTGFELLEKMSAKPLFTLPPVIVYTGRQLSRADEERLYRYSRSIIVKGARSPERLLDEVTLFLHQSDAELSEENKKMLLTSRSRDRNLEGRTILVVDDDVRNVFALTHALEAKGAIAAIARNGREAVESVEAKPEIELILMDIMMPEMDGLEAMKKIRESSSRPNIPIIAITAKAMQDDYEKCLAAGANDYLPKPVDVDKLLSLIRVWIPKRMVP